MRREALELVERDVGVVEPALVERKVAEEVGSLKLDQRKLTFCVAQCSVQQLAGEIEFLPRGRAVREAHPVRGGPAHVAELAEDPEALLVAGHRNVEVALLVRRARDVAKRPRPQPRRDSFGAGEQVSDAAHSFRGGMRAPEVLVRAGELKAESRVAVGRPVEGGPQILRLRQPHGPVEGLVGILAEMRDLRDRDHPLGEPSLDVVGFA